MKKLDSYIIKKFLGTFFYAISLIILIAVVFDYSEKIDDFLENDAPLNKILFDYYLNFIPFFANMFSYLFTFIAVIYFTSKMAAQSEISAILSSGISFNRMLVPYFISAAIIAIFTFVLGSYIIPPANETRLDFENEYIFSRYSNTEKHIHRQIAPGVLIYMENYSATNDIGYKFSMEKFEDGRLKTKLLSDYIKWDTTKNKWAIHNYTIRQIDGMDEKLQHGALIDTTLNMKPEEFRTRQNVVETMNLTELNHFIDQQIERGVESVEYYLIEKHKRIAAPFSVFILTLIGVSLSVRKTRGGIGAHIGIGILLSFSHILFMQVSHQFAISGSLTPMLAVWVPNILFLFIGIVLYLNAPK